jgi:MinD-like ATPase involved in chromosome partitioning or flagellar assembly
VSTNDPQPTARARTSRDQGSIAPRPIVRDADAETESIDVTDESSPPEGPADGVVSLDDLMGAVAPVEPAEETRPEVLRTAPQQLVPTAPARPAPTPAQWGWRIGRWTGGLVNLRPTSAELRHRDNLHVIATRSWPRPVNVAVLNLKGGSGKTPTALTLAGLLAGIRGGGVVVYEACDTAGTLASRSEGAGDRGLPELLATGEVESSVRLSAYMQRQSSHADVLASQDPRRRLLTGADVMATRRVLDRFYSISVTDTGINPTSGPWRAAVLTADAVVLPVTYTSDALAGAVAVLDILRAAEPAFSDPERGLIARTLVVLSDPGGRAPRHVVQQIQAGLCGLGLPVVPVPFDPALQDGPILPDNLTAASRRAWIAATAKAVELCGGANLDVDLVDPRRQQPAGEPAPAAVTGS